jgi:toxin YoeB
MTWRILILRKAEDDLAWHRRHHRRQYVKCFDLIREIATDPRQGTGKPERLKYLDREVWSRRVSHEDRMVYVVYAEEGSVEIVSCRSHYEVDL